MWEKIGFWAGVCLPLWDIPLMVHIIRRQSSADISLMWIFGLWLTSVLMAPSAFVSKDAAAIGFNVVNVLMLSLLFGVVYKYRKGKA